MGSLYKDNGNNYEDYQHRRSIEIFKDGKSSLRNDGTSRVLQSLAGNVDPYRQFYDQDNDIPDFTEPLTNGDIGTLNSSTQPSGHETSFFTDYVTSSESKWRQEEIANELNLYNGIPRSVTGSEPSIGRPDIDPTNNYPLKREPSAIRPQTKGSLLPFQREQTLEEQIGEEFNDYVDALSPMSQEQREFYKNNSTHEKSRHMNNQKSRSPVFQVKHYMDVLRLHHGSTGRRISKSSTSKKDLLLSSTLRQLKLDLLLSDDKFILDFINWRHGPNGISALLGVLADIKAEQPSVGNKNQSLANKMLNDECDTLLCLQFAFRNKFACEKLIDYKPGITLIAESLLSNFIKNRVITLKILTRLCEVPGGYYKISDVMSDMRKRYQYTLHYQPIISSLQKQTDAPVKNTYLPFLVEALRFLNAILYKTDSIKSRIFLQHETSLGGFNVEKLERKASGGTNMEKDLSYEIIKWKQHQSKSLTGLEGGNITEDHNRTQTLRDEVDRLQDQMKMLQDDFLLMEQEKIDEMERNEGYKHMVTRLQDTVEKLNNMYINATGVAPTKEQVDLQIAMQPLDMPSYMMPLQTNRRVYRPEKRRVYHYEPNKPEKTSNDSSTEDSGDDEMNGLDTGTGHGKGRSGGGGKGVLSGSEVEDRPANKRTKSRGKKKKKKKPAVSESSSDTSESEDDPTSLFVHSPKRKPAVPVPEAPAAPFMAPAPEDDKDRIQPNVPLPFLNWTPLHNTDNTIFDGMDDVVNDIDFENFEEEFKLPNRDNNSNVHVIKNPKTQQKIEKVLFVPVNRARNMIITKTKIKLDGKQTKDAISRCDTRLLDGEYAKMLLAYVPNEEELENIAANRDKFSRMGEAEQYLTELSEIDRLQEKLNVMAFMGLFDDYQDNLKPQIDCILWSSNSLLRSDKFRQVLAIVLAFGNYMNSHKRGIAKGFKIESLNKLLDVKSTDRRMTLMHYLSDMIANNYPDLLDFYQEMDINVLRGISYKAIQSDINWLRKGLDLVRHEKVQQPDNLLLQDFYEHAHAIVLILSDLFRQMDEAYQQVCEFFGEKHQNIDPNEFFSAITTFIQNFKNSIEENKQRHLQASGIIIPKSRSNGPELPSQTREKINPEMLKKKLKHIDDKTTSINPSWTDMIKEDQTVNQKVHEIEQWMDGQNQPTFVYRPPLMQPTISNPPAQAVAIDQDMTSDTISMKSDTISMSSDSISMTSMKSSRSSIMSIVSEDAPSLSSTESSRAPSVSSRDGWYKTPSPSLTPVPMPSIDPKQSTASRSGFVWDDIPFESAEKGGIAPSDDDSSINASSIHSIGSEPVYSVPKKRSSIRSYASSTNVSKVLGDLDNLLDGFDTDGASIISSTSKQSYSSGRSSSQASSVPPVPRKSSITSSPASSRTITPVPTPRSSALQTLFEDVERRRSQFQTPTAQSKGQAPPPPNLSKTSPSKTKAPAPPVPRVENSSKRSSIASYDSIGPQRPSRKATFDVPESDGDSDSTIEDEEKTKASNRKRRQTPFHPNKPVLDEDTDDTVSTTSTTPSVAYSDGPTRLRKSPKNITFDEDAISDKPSTQNKFKRKNTPYLKAPTIPVDTDEDDDTSVDSASYNFNPGDSNDDRSSRDNQSVTSGASSGPSQYDLRL